MIHSDDWKAVLTAMKEARLKHPVFPSDIVKMTAIMAEEAGEALREANTIDEGKGNIEDLKTELYQTIGVCFRTLDRLRNYYGK